jgi:phosphoribosylanthranilate isomerase
VATRLKVCCIASVAEAEIALEHGAWAIGLVARMPSGPGPIADELIAEIARSVPPHVATFLLTSRTDGDAIVEHVEATGVNTVQIVDAVETRAYSVIRRALPRVRIVQVIHVRDSGSLDEARLAAEHVDVLLLDSGNPTLAVKELGGTGRTHDWMLSRAIVDSVRKPVFLAGGIRAENVAEAIARVRPHGIDLCSGVRTSGALDAAKLRALRGEMTRADFELASSSTPR